MASASNPVPAIVPNVQTPKLIGTLSIIFASLLLVCEVGNIFMVAFGPTLGRLMQASIKAQQDAFDANIKAEKDTLDRREKAAKTDEEKAKIQAERDALAKRPNPAVTMNINGMDQFQNPTIMRVMYATTFTGVPINVLMLASGVGLLGLKKWGRSLAIWVAGTKIVRLAILFIVTVVYVLPVSLEMQKKQFDQADAQIKANGGAGGAPPGMTMGDMAKMTAGLVYASNLVYYLLAPVFPIVVLIALTRPRATAAFELAARPKPAAASDWEELT